MPRTLQEHLEAIKESREHSLDNTLIESIEEIVNNETEFPSARVHAIKEVLQKYTAIRNEEEGDEE